MSNDTFAHSVYGWEVEILPEEMEQLNAIAEEFVTEEPCGNDIQETIDELMEREPDEPGHLQMLEWLNRVSARLALQQGVGEIYSQQNPVIVNYLLPHFVAADCYEGCQVEPGSVVFGLVLHSFPAIMLPANPAVNALLKAMQYSKAEWLTWVT